MFKIGTEDLKKFLTEFNSLVSKKENFNIQSQVLSENLKKINNLHATIVSINQQLKHSNSDVQDTYEKIKGIYKKAIQRISELKAQLSSSNNMELQMQAISTEDSLNSDFRSLNNAFLNDRPLIKIEYGDPCIGDLKVRSPNAERLQGMPIKYEGFREIRGDGNCFISSFITRFLENAVEQKTLNEIISMFSEKKIEKLKIPNKKLIPETSRKSIGNFNLSSRRPIKTQRNFER